MGNRIDVQPPSESVSNVRSMWRSADALRVGADAPAPSLSGLVHLSAVLGPREGPEPLGDRSRRGTQRMERAPSEALSVRVDVGRARLSRLRAGACPSPA